MTSFLNTSKRIVKVNHAGEYGAIRIYRAQLYIAKLFFKDIATFLSEVLQHEEMHCTKFKVAMDERNIKPCYTMRFWSIGGTILGAITALMGRNMIMICTEAVESTVHQHMNDQISFLQGKDDELKDMIIQIREDEIEHLKYAQARAIHTLPAKIVSSIISICTNIVIWLSTHGDSSRMCQELQEPK